MLRKARRILALLALIWICAWVVYSSDTFQNCIQYNEATSTQENTKESAPDIIFPIYRKCVGAFIETNHDGIIAAFTIVLALSTIWLWLSTKDAAVATQRAARVSEDALTKLERAFVSFSTKTVALSDPITNVIHTYRITMEVKNSGHTPTKGYYSHASWDGFLGDIPKDFTYPDKGVSGEEPKPNVPGFIGPGENVSSGRLFIPIAFMEAARQGHIRLYVWGWAEYDDVFVGTPPHRTEFCNEVVVTADPYVQGQEMPFGLRIAFPHIGADDECYHKARPRNERHKPIK
jgi:hypothetical protein